jgi:hypothetical protein
MAIEPHPIPPELPGPGDETPPTEVPVPFEPEPVPDTPPQV